MPVTIKLVIDEPRYAPASPRQKAVSLGLLAASAITFVIYWSGWRTFGGYEKQVAIIATITMALYAVRLLEILKQA